MKLTFGGMPIEFDDVSKPSYIIVSIDFMIEYNKIWDKIEFDQWTDAAINADMEYEYGMVMQLYAV